MKKSGYKTTEFWAFALTALAATLLALLGKVDGDVAMGIIAGGGALYTGSRTIVKR